MKPVRKLAGFIFKRECINQNETLIYVKKVNHCIKFNVFIIQDFEP